MDFQLNADQQALVDALQTILADHRDLSQDVRLKHFHHDAGLQQVLQETGFLQAARSIGPLEATLIIIETAKLPSAVEVGVTGLVAPMTLPDHALSGPLGICDMASLAEGIRFLPVSRSLLLDAGEDVLIVDVDGANVEPVASIFAYPIGRFRVLPDLACATRVTGAGPALRQWWRVAIAAEIAGAARAAIDFTIEHVKQRHVLGRPVGAFQSVQHRLVQCHGYAVATYYLALRAAWSGLPEHADVAACYAQSGIPKLMFDLHQFNGAMGVTNEHLLHFWTYRIRALQAEAGGRVASALDLAPVIRAGSREHVDQGVCADTHTCAA